MTTGTASPSKAVWGVRSSRALAVLAGMALDRVVGDPPDRWHPVAWYGRAMTAQERWLWRDHRPAGILHAAAGVGLGGGAAALLAEGARRLPGGLPAGTRGTAGTAVAVVTAVTVTAVVGARSLDRAAASVAEALDAGDLRAARALLPTLVGRDPARLDAGEVARAVVESVAENTVDAVVAPVLWAAVAGPAGAGAYRAVNTLDAMVGHRSARYRNFGWASARADDAANLVPARLAALLVAAVRPRRAGAVWRAVRRDAPAHPSPNAGVVEAAFAAALGVRLGGSNTYGGRPEERGVLGGGRPVEVADIAAARGLARDLSWAMAALLAGVGLLARAFR